MQHGTNTDYAKARPALHAAKTPAGLAIEIAPAPVRGMITLRGDLASPAMAEAVRAATGLKIPGVRKVTGTGETLVLWMSPDELMIHCAYAEAPAKTAQLAQALADEHSLVFDVSDARQVITLKGAGAREVLAKGAPVDLRAGAFGVGDLRRTRIGTIAAAFYQTAAEPESFEVFCFGSNAAYLFDWLCASAKEGSLPGVL